MIRAYLQKVSLLGRDVRLYLVASALFGFSWDGIRAVLLNLYLLRLGYSPKQIGWVNAVWYLVGAAFCLPAGAVGKRWGCRRALTAGMGMMTLSVGLLPLAESVPPAWQMGWIVGTNVIAGIGSGLFIVNGLPFLMATTGKEERTHAFSVTAAIGPLSAFIGSLAGGALPQVFAAATAASLESAAPYPLPAAALCPPARPRGVDTVDRKRGPRPQSTGPRVPCRARPLGTDRPDWFDHCVQIRGVGNSVHLLQRLPG